MDVGSIVTLVTEIGFPLVMVGVCIFFIWKMYQEQLADKERLHDQLELAMTYSDDIDDVLSQIANAIENQDLEVRIINNPDDKTNE
ncbi:MAG: hypothetical protein BEN19_04475 [Epulopiscium sp. Nuni2H_MBin003]|nr:MAG: hypothetical protein BEN19_04475 [Epulopiscium sp. Nuni2H_MBin003]